LAVDNEPEPFWDGSDEAERIEEWKHSVGFSADYGTVAGAGSLNGPSGAWVRDRVLVPFGETRSTTWFTDCLDTYRGSDAQAAALDDRFNTFAADAGIPTPLLPPHPSENGIVTEALTAHRDRLVTELHQARPTNIVTLGNAAMRVLRELVNCEQDPGEAIGNDAADYGQTLPVAIDEHQSTWYPLCHPASPARYQDLHKAWRP
jgi:hypothetical protein